MTLDRPLGDSEAGGYLRRRQVFPISENDAGTLLHAQLVNCGQNIQVRLIEVGPFRQRSPHLAHAPSQRASMMRSRLIEDRAVEICAVVRDRGPRFPTEGMETRIRDHVLSVGRAYNTRGEPDEIVCVLPVDLFVGHFEYVTSPVPSPGDTLSRILLGLIAAYDMSPQTRLQANS